MMTLHIDRPSLLLLEDDARLAPLVVEILEEEYDVTWVQDGGRALQVGAGGQFDLLVLDRRVPTLDGLDVVRQLRGAQVSAPILVLSALVTSADTDAAIHAGADDCLGKPFEIEELLRRLRALRPTSRVAEREAHKAMSRELR